MSGLLEGFCDRCGWRFDFTQPVLAEGTLVAGQYRVEGPIGRGGLGWVYRAKDHKVSERLCALKGLIASEGPDAADIEHEEREALARLSHHTNIVTYYNYADHDDRGYIVMEYLGGLTLEEKLRQGARRKPLPVTDAIAYALAVVPAFGDIHREKRVYCDFKPDNVMHVGDAVKLIDLGAVRQLREPGESEDPRRPIQTRGYHAKEVLHGRPSVASDLYTVGRTLAALTLDVGWKDWNDTYRYRLPPAEQHAILVVHDCLRRFLERACADDPAQRFLSAEEMAEQLEGVLRQVAATVKRRPTPYRETRWREPQDTLDPLDRRTLPPPILPDHPDQRNQIPHTADGNAAIQILNRLGTGDVKLSWRDHATATLAHCERDPHEAERWVQGLDPGDAETGSDASTVSSAREYLKGVVLLEQGARNAKREPAAAERKFREATDRFKRAYNASPGEAACALAYAASSERLASLLALRRWSETEATACYQRAAGLYDQVAWAYPSWTGAVAGLARTLRALGRRTDAAMAYLVIPDTHQLRADALTRACETMRERTDHGSGSDSTLLFDRRIAREIVKYLANTQPRNRPAPDAQLAAKLYQTALEALHSDETIPGWVVSHEETARSPRRESKPAATERELRTRAEAALWELAEVTPEPRKQKLLDGAARIGPWRFGITDPLVDWGILKPLPPPLRDDGSPGDASDRQPFSISLFYNEHLHPRSDTIDVIARVTANRPSAGPTTDLHTPKVTGHVRGRAEIIIFDNSPSMDHDEKLESAKKAAIEAVKLLDDGVYFSVVAGNWDSQPIYPRARELAVATSEAREAAVAAIETVRTRHGTRIGRWLQLADELASSVELSVCHVILLTDGENNESLDMLTDVVEACHGTIQCDVVGFETEWRVEELYRVAEGLSGTMTFIPRSEDLVDHFRELMARSLGRTVHGVRLAPEVPADIDIHAFRQVNPHIVRLRARYDAAGGAPSDTYLTGSWMPGESRDYHIRLHLPPGKTNECRRACRLNVLLGSGESAASTPIVVGWTNDMVRFAEVDSLVASYTDQMELRNNIRLGFNALGRRDRPAAEAAFSRATRLAFELGRQDVLRWLEQIVHIIDATRGAIELREDRSAEARLHLLTSSVYTSRTHRYGQEPLVASCAKQTCGWPARASARYCERCGRNLTTGGNVVVVRLQASVDRGFHDFRAGREGSPGPPPTDRRPTSFELSGGRMVLGRRADRGSGQADIALADPGLQPCHGILDKDEDGLWTLSPATDDRHSFWVREPSGFRPLSDEPRRMRDGDEIFLGWWTCITVEIDL